MSLTTSLPEWTGLVATGRTGKKGEDKEERSEKSSPKFTPAIYLSLNLSSPPIKTYINQMLVHIIKNTQSSKKVGILA